MRFHQIREVVRWAADYHDRLANLYRLKADGEVSERVRMALGYLAEHEDTMLEVLERYLSEESEHRGILDTWFDEPADIPHTQDPETLAAGNSHDSVQSVLATALATHRNLQDLYSHRAEHATTAAERDFFEALTNGDASEVRRLSRDMQRLEDY